MQVKIELNHFEGHAELTGAELDALTKILTKFFGTDQRYVNSRYVQVRTDTKIKAKIEIDPDVEFMARAQFNTQEAAEKAEKARVAEEQRVARQVAEEQRVARQVAMENAMLTQDNATTEALIALLEEQALLYWYERSAWNPTRDWLFENGQVQFTVGKADAPKAIIIDAQGNFSRHDV